MPRQARYWKGLGKNEKKMPFFLPYCTLGELLGLLLIVYQEVAPKMAAGFFDSDKLTVCVARKCQSGVFLAFGTSFEVRLLFNSSKEDYKA